MISQQQAFAVSEVTLKEDPTDDSIIYVILQNQNQTEENWVIIFYILDVYIRRRLKRKLVK